MDERWSRATGCPTHFFALVVVQHPGTGLWLAVEETRNRGWWLPGGFVENGDTIQAAAVRECAEEAGVDIELRGVLRIECSLGARAGRHRVIFYAIPCDPAQQPKSVADDESKSARWLSIADLAAMEDLPPPDGLRGSELLHWARYVEAGGIVYPLALLATESTPIVPPTRVQGCIV